MQGLVFMAVTFEKCTTNLYFKNCEVGIKARIANLQPLLAWKVSACLRTFIQLRFQKSVFSKLGTFLISSTRRFQGN